MWGQMVFLRKAIMGQTKLGAIIIINVTHPRKLIKGYAKNDEAPRTSAIRVNSCNNIIANLIERMKAIFLITRHKNVFTSTASPSSSSSILSYAL